MTEIYNNTIFGVQLLDKFIINRGYSKESLQLIAFVYRRKWNAEIINNIEIILNYQKRALIFQMNKLCETHKTESLCVANIKYKHEILVMVSKSLLDARYIQCYLLVFKHYSDVSRMMTFINIQSIIADTFPHYSSTLFEHDSVLHSPLNCIMRSFEVEEAKVLNVKCLSPNQNENLSKSWTDDSINDLKVDDQKFQIYDSNSFTSIQSDKAIIEDKSRYESLVKTSRLYLVITTDVSIQFLDTRLKKLNAEIFYINLKEIIRQTDQLDKVLLIVSNIINTHQYSLESIDLQFVDPTSCKKFVDTISNKGQIQYRSLKMCQNCPIHVINRFSHELNEETDDFQFDEPDKMEKYCSISRLHNLINSYLEKTGVLINNISHESFGDQIISVFEALLKKYEKLQSNHNCNLQNENKSERKVSFKLWENVKNLFNKKISIDKSLDNTDGYPFILKNEDKNKEKYDFPTNDNDGSLLRTVTSRTRRVISVNEHIMQRVLTNSMNHDYNCKTDSFSILAHEKAKDPFLYAGYLISERPSKLSFKSLGLVILAVQRLMKACNFKWNFPPTSEYCTSNKYPICYNDAKSKFGSNELLSYSLITITNNSFDKVNQEWEGILRNNDKETSYFNKIVKDGVSVLQRREAWKLLIRTSSHLNSDKILKYDLSPNFQDILAQMIAKDIFECDLAKEFYKQSFIDMKRSNSDILNDVGRTMPQISYFSIHCLGQLALYNVLRAYAILDPEVSYCQGMNFIVSIFLLHFNEEEAFIALIFYMVFLERREIYLPTLIGIKHSFYKLERLVNDFCPALNYHLLDKNVPISLYASSWVMTLFVTTYPLHFVVRVFDMILAEGPAIIFNISITLISYVADKVLLLMDFDLIHDHFCKLLNNLSDDDLTQILHKASEVNINRNLRIYDLEITCNIKDIVGDNECIQQLCIENTDLRLENIIFRKKIESMQKEIMELKRLFLNLSKN